MVRSAAALLVAAFFTGGIAARDKQPLKQHPAVTTLFEYLDLVKDGEFDAADRLSSSPLPKANWRTNVKWMHHLLTNKNDPLVIHEVWELGDDILSGSRLKDIRPGEKRVFTIHLRKEKGKWTVRSCAMNSQGVWEHWVFTFRQRKGRRVYKRETDTK